MTQRLIHNPGREQITAAIKGALNAYPNRSELARRLGVSRKQTYEWEAGNNVPGLEVLASLAEITGVPIVLAFGPDTETPAPAKPERVDEIADAVTTRLEDRLQQLEDSIAARVAEETSRLVLRSVERTEQGEDDPDQTDDHRHVAGQDG